MSAPTTIQWIRQAVQRIGTGSVRLAVHLAARAAQGGRSVWRRAVGWLGEGSGIGWLLRLAVLLGVAALLRKVVTAVALGLYERVESGAAPGLMFGAAGVWVVAAYRCGRDGWEPKRRGAETGEPMEGEPDEEESAPVEQAPAGPPLPTFQQLCAALDRVGTPHAHIAVLAADLGTSSERVREALDRCGVSVTDVRMRGRGSSTGIKGDALPAPAAPSDGVVGAGQPANNDNNNAWTAVDDDRNPVRTHVVWHDG